MDRAPRSIERRPLAVGEEIVWTLFGLVLLVTFLVLLIQDQTS